MDLRRFTTRRAMAGRALVADSMPEKPTRAHGRCGVRASYDVSITYSNALVASSVDGMTINGVSIGSFSVVPGDQNGNMVNAINAATRIIIINEVKN